MPGIAFERPLPARARARRAHECIACARAGTGRSHAQPWHVPRTPRAARGAACGTDVARRVRDGGSFSGERGDGQARAQFLPKMYGEELIEAFRRFKAAWDPARRGRWLPAAGVAAAALTAAGLLGRSARARGGERRRGA
ncbi:FAD-linked oxidase C-terminal domain-containing protein [Sorangium sp. So ce834]|uniref:FAD-binding oxidoreductase n=1 Tax=Sorangium sp. So ce834 TaxID=3133321 RepID=UPI003F5E0D1F